MSTFPVDKKPFCREPLLRVDVTTRCCGLRLETSLWIPCFAILLQRLGDAGEDQRHVQVKLLFHIEHHHAKFEPGKRTLAHHTWPTVQHTRAARTIKYDVLLAAGTTLATHAHNTIVLVATVWTV